MQTNSSHSRRWWHSRVSQRWDWTQQDINSNMNHDRWNRWPMSGPMAKARWLGLTDMCRSASTSTKGERLINSYNGAPHAADRTTHKNKHQAFAWQDPQTAPRKDQEQLSSFWFSGVGSSSFQVKEMNIGNHQTGREGSSYIFHFHFTFSIYDMTKQPSLRPSRIQAERTSPNAL